MNLPDWQVFGGLVLAHYLGDYSLQGQYLSIEKRRNFYLMLVHCFIWTGTVTVAAVLLGGHPGFATVLFLMFLPHVIIDTTKVKTSFFGAGAQALVMDQGSHFIQLLLFYMVVFGGK